MEQGNINFFSETEFTLEREEENLTWLKNLISSEHKTMGEINFIFCDDEMLHDINVEYLSHDTLTDIISFDNGIGNILHGDIYISIERVRENAGIFNVDFNEELRRVMAHGILHFCGYKDKSQSESDLMRQKEDEKIKMFHVEQ